MLRYAITDRKLVGADEPARRRGLIRLARHVAELGVEYLQVREKDLEDAELSGIIRELAAEVAEVGRERAGLRTRLLVNGDCDLALAGGADGVHLTSAAGELTPGKVRRAFAAAGRGTALVSMSCHTIADVERAAASAPEDRPNLILFGPVFEKQVTGRWMTAGTGLDLLAEACVAADGVPVLGLGGVTMDNALAVVEAGAAGIAGIRLFLP